MDFFCSIQYLEICGPASLKMMKGTKWACLFDSYNVSIKENLVQKQNRNPNWHIFNEWKFLSKPYHYNVIL